jgi:O-acetylhomoserine/O-acetylserine sulfhydrylase-like pyridoxal-dependent enzyme
MGAMAASGFTEPDHSYRASGTGRHKAFSPGRAVAQDIAYAMKMRSSVLRDTGATGSRRFNSFLILHGIGPPHSAGGTRANGLRVRVVEQHDKVGG